MKPKKTKDPREDKFEFLNDHIKVISGSGNEYTITLERCTCRGFGFHRICRHFEEAQNLGLIEQLKSRLIVAGELAHSSGAVLLRKDAIRKYLAKYGKTFTEDKVEKIESILKSTTKPEEVLSMAD